jgi:hypothetical protein
MGDKRIQTDLGFIICSKSAQHRVQWTLGILARFQAVFYALAFFWLDGFAVPAPAPLTQAVGRFICEGL